MFARYRSTATLILLLLMGGYRSPHKTIDQYVEAFTDFKPTDGRYWTDREDVLPTFPVKSMVRKLDFDKMGEFPCFNLVISNSLKLTIHRCHADVNNVPSCTWPNRLWLSFFRLVHFGRKSDLCRIWFCSAQKRNQ